MDGSIWKNKETLKRPTSLLLKINLTFLKFSNSSKTDEIKKFFVENCFDHSRSNYRVERELRQHKCIFQL